MSPNAPAAKGAPAAGDAPAAEESLLEQATALTKAAGELTLQWFSKSSLTYRLKADGTEVSEADLAVERYLRNELAQHFSDDLIIGEEFGGDTASGRRAASVSGRRTWIIDPIDGTRGFVRGVPLYATLLALVDEHGPLIGIIHFPALNQTLAAGRQIGCWLDEQRCGVSANTELKGALINTSDFATFRVDQFQKISEAGAMLRTWGDAYGYFMVATGKAEAMIDPICEAWDLAPMPVIMGEAGGAFTDLQGNNSYTSRNGVATNGHLHSQVLAALKTTAESAQGTA